MIISRTPFRISFFGGGTDYPAWYHKNGGAVLSTTIDKYCYIMVRELPPFFPFKYRIAYSKIENTNRIDAIEHPAIKAVLRDMDFDFGLEIHIAADLPARSGIGSSSTFVVGLLKALYGLKGQEISPAYLASEAIRIEQDILKENVGSQDQTAAAYGGLNVIHFPMIGEAKVEPLAIQPQRIAELNEHLLLFFTGLTRSASAVAKSQIDNLSTRHAELKHMQSLVDRAVNVLASQSDLLEFDELLHETWLYKKKLSHLITNSEIDGIYDAARAAGAAGGKLLGAGNGGFMLIAAEPKRHRDICDTLSNLIRVPIKINSSGSELI